MDFIIGIIAGVILGVWGYILTHKRIPSGTFIMDFSNPDEEFCKLVMEEDLNSIYTKKEITLRIEARDFDSQN